MKISRKRRIQKQMFERFTQMLEDGNTDIACPLCKIKENRYHQNPVEVSCDYCNEHKLWCNEKKCMSPCIDHMREMIGNNDFMFDLQLSHDDGYISDGTSTLGEIIDHYRIQLIWLRAICVAAADRIPEE